MDTNQKRHICVDLTTKQYQVQTPLNRIAIGVQDKWPVFCVYWMRRNVFDGFFCLKAIMNQIRDRADFQIMFSSKNLQLRSPGHAAVFIQNFYQNRCGVIEGQVQLFDAKAKILMLDDERIIAFDSCSIASDVDGVQKEEDE